MVPVLALLTVRKQLATSNQVVQLTDGFLRVVALGTVQITVKDAWVPVDTHQDQGVREGFEAGRDPSFEGLTDLSVVLSVSTPFQGP